MGARGSFLRLGGGRCMRRLMPESGGRVGVASYGVLGPNYNTCAWGHTQYCWRGNKTDMAMVFVKSVVQEPRQI